MWIGDYIYARIDIFYILHQIIPESFFLVKFVLYLSYAWVIVSLYHQYICVNIDILSICLFILYNLPLEPVFFGKIVLYISWTFVIPPLCHSTYWHMSILVWHYQFVWIYNVVMLSIKSCFFVPNLSTSNIFVSPLKILLFLNFRAALQF